LEYRKQEENGKGSNKVKIILFSNRKSRKRNKKFQKNRKKKSFIFEIG